MKKLKIILQSNYLYIILIILSFIYVFLANQKEINSNLNSDKNEYVGIIDYYKVSGNLLTLEIKIDHKENLIGYYYFDTLKEMNNFNNNYMFGDKIKIKGKVEIPSNNTIPNLFNYKEYLKTKKTYYQINIEKITKLSSSNDISYKLKNNMYEHIKNLKSSEYIYTLILGNKDYLDKNISNAYQELGISHLLAISGMHITTLCSIFIFLLKKIRIKDEITYVIIIPFLILYDIILGYPPSATRAILMFIILGLNKILKLKLKTIYIWCLVFIISILNNPYLINNVAFQYSFLISFVLIICQNKLANNSFIKNLFLISLISFLSGLPITINSFFQFNLLTIFLNIIYVPLITFIIYPLCLLTIIIKEFDNILFYILDYINMFTIYLNKLTIFKVIVAKPNLSWIILYYLILFIIIKFDRKKYYILLVLLLIFQIYNNDIINKKFVITIDVGQGDSTLIYLNNKTILIDTGGKISYNKEKWKIRNSQSLTEKTTLPLLKSLGIRKINYLILTHGDYDHMGEAINLVNNFKVENVIFNNGEFNDLETKMIKVLDGKNIRYYKGLKELNIGSDKLYFLNTKEYDNENDNSNVIYFKLNGYKFLLMGDAGITREKDIIRKYNLTNIDFIKLGHHGSNTSSSKEFINNIKPKNCLISVGKNNRYGHPKESVLDILDDYCDIYRTDLYGSIEIKLNKNNYNIKTYSP